MRVVPICVTNGHMPCQVITRGAFGPGADLWIMPEEALCPPIQGIDWELNFQLRAAACLAAPGAPVLVSSSAVFENRFCLKLPWQKNWILEAMKHMADFSNYSVRVFLAKSIAVEDFCAAWHGKSRGHLLQKGPKRVQLVEATSLERLLL